MHWSGKTNPADPLSQRSDFEKAAEDDNKAKILLLIHLFTPDSSNVIVTHSVEMQKQLIHDGAQAYNSESVESMIRKLQHKRKKYTSKNLSKEDSQLILVHVMGAPGQEASKTEPQWCDSDDIDNAWQLRSSMHRHRAETYKMSH